MIDQKFIIYQKFDSLRNRTFIDLHHIQQINTITIMKILFGYKLDQIIKSTDNDLRPWIVVARNNQKNINNEL